MSVRRSEKNKKRKARKKRAELRIASRVRKPRACGPCYSCCKVFPVKGLPEYEGEKPEGTTCKWVTDNEEFRCGTYTNRPPVCGKYECVWIHDGRQKQRLFFANERPDILGVLFDLSGPEHLATKALGGRPVLIAREFREGAYETAEVKTTFNRFLDLGKVIVTIPKKGEYNYLAQNQADAQAVALAYKKMRLFKVISDQVEASGGAQYDPEGKPMFDVDEFQIDP
jgi:hypothetical protein